MIVCPCMLSDQDEALGSARAAARVAILLSSRSHSIELATAAHTFTGAASYGGVGIFTET